MDIRNKRVSIIGAGKSGLAAAKALSEMGAQVLISDIRTEELVRATAQAEGVPDSVRIEFGGHTEQLLNADFIVLSPGVRTDIPILQAASSKGIPIHSEIEIAYRISKGKRLVITGSNGKTTTTTLVGKLCKGHFHNVWVGGNIGIPMIGFASKTADGDLQVLETSSFQLETISAFTPDIGVITNFFENHLDRYSSYSDYCQAKERIALNMNEFHWLVLNADQEALRQLGSRAACRKAWFGWNVEGLKPSLTIVDSMFVYSDAEGNLVPLFNESLVKLIGRHNRENIMAAALSAILAGVPPESIGQVVGDFRGVEHRLEWVASIGGIDYINDSKGTNCAAAITALNACTGAVILLAGGKDKGTDLEEWARIVSRRARGVILFGEARERLRAALEGLIPIKTAGELGEAIGIASNWAVPGDSVLLSPGCSSYDQFTNFEERGRFFKDAVHKLEAK